MADVGSFKLIKFINHKKHIYTPKGCVPYERNPPHGFQRSALEKKRGETDDGPDIRGDANKF